MESAGETILSVPPLLHLLAIQQQQKQKQQQNNGNNADTNNATNEMTLSSSDGNFCIAEQQMQIGTNGSESAEESGASDGENGRGEKRREEEEEKQQGKLEIIEESATPPPLFRQQTLQFAEEMMDMKMESPRDLHIQIPPFNAFNGHGTPSMAQSAASTPTEQQTNKPLPVIKPPGDEKEERPSLSYKDLIIEAIESSPERRLKLSEIYQVIKYLHPYNQRRSDQWGWQNSIRHNLSLHDCFVKLPLKQTSANGVVGHFWTVVTRGPDEKPLGPTRRRTRGSGKAKKGTMASMAFNGSQNGGTAANTPSGIKHGTIKGLKGRQSVSSDSGVMSDEGGACSHSNSPTEMGTRSVPLLHANAEAVAPARAAQFSANLFQFPRPTAQTPTQQIAQHHHRVQAVHSPAPTPAGHGHAQSQLSPLELVLQMQHQHNQQQQLQQHQQQHLHPFASLQQFSPIPKSASVAAGVADEVNSAPAAASTPTLIMPNDAIGGAAANNNAFLPCELQQLLAIAALTQQHHQPQQPMVAVSAANGTSPNNSSNNNNLPSFHSPPPPAAPDHNTMTLLQLLNTAGTSSGTPPSDGGLGLLSNLATQLAPAVSPAPPQHSNNVAVGHNLLASAAAAATAELQRLHMIQLYAQQQQQQLQQQLAALLEQQQQQQQLHFQQREMLNPAATALSDVLSVAAGCHDQSALVAQLLLSRLMHSPTATSTSSSSNGSYEQQMNNNNGQPKNGDSSPAPPQNNGNNAMGQAQHLMELQRAALLLDQQQQYQASTNSQRTVELSSNAREVQAVSVDDQQHHQQQQSLDMDAKQEMDQQQELTVV
ncbi:hypothetical protein niasHT_003508 [Heterodera trifolii]|uniref:Fork-head domain-containing protein n=1 Tax=Heterodera trifolii TaxID=157864 RepID=A0ABD2LVH1_9BILA